MKWTLTSVILATLIATPTLAARQHLNRDSYWNATPVAQICPAHVTWNYYSRAATDQRRSIGQYFRFHHDT